MYGKIQQQYGWIEHTIHLCACKIWAWTKKNARRNKKEKRACELLRVELLMCNPQPTKIHKLFPLVFLPCTTFFSSAFRRSPPSTHIGLFANIFWFIYYQSMPGDEIVPLSSANLISSAQEILCWQHFRFPWHGREAPPGQFILLLVHITFSNCH